MNNSIGSSDFSKNTESEGSVACRYFARNNCSSIASLYAEILLHVLYMYRDKKNFLYYITPWLSLIFTWSDCTMSTAAPSNNSLFAFHAPASSLAEVGWECFASYSCYHLSAVVWTTYYDIPRKLMMSSHMLHTHKKKIVSRCITVLANQFFFIFNFYFTKVTSEERKYILWKKVNYWEFE